MIHVDSLQAHRQFCCMILSTAMVINVIEDSGMGKPNLMMAC